MAAGRLLLAGTVEEVRQRVVRLRLRYETGPPSAAGLGTLLQLNGHGRQWQAVVQDPDRAAVMALQANADISDFEESPLGLEEVYVALVAGKIERADRL
jgi:hypothetical protein